MSDHRALFLKVNDMNAIPEIADTTRSAVTCLVNSPHNWNTTVAMASEASHTSFPLFGSSAVSSFRFRIMSPTIEPAIAIIRY